ncbi:MAG: hypothetical protein PHY12_06445 [Eubacteriales bacterium]|nr:hypothetical protein [Eubacteriales bacterium]
MMWLWIGLALLSAFAGLFFWEACKIGAEADAHTEKAFQEMMKRRSQNAGGVSYEEVTSDASGS